MIRKAEVEDLYKIISLEKKVFKEPLSEQFLYQELTLNPFGFYLVLEERHALLGYIGFRVVDDQAEMMNFAIDPTYHKMGYGKTLLAYALDALLTKQVKTITLEVRKSNKVAIYLYESFGFKKAHIRKNYYENEDGIVYMKEVTSCIYSQ